MQNISAKKLWQMMKNAAVRLAQKSGEINDLNVFPVPDGDTGTNMSMTLSGIDRYTGNFDHIGTCAKALADGTLRAARGNSGVILSVFLRGFAKELREKETADTIALSAAFARGTTAAYGAVMNPTEGTILSVMRAVSENAAQTVAQGPIVTPEELFSLLCTVAKEALDRTPDQLAILKQSGLVDAGGYGFLIILQGMTEALAWPEDRMPDGYVTPAAASDGMSAAAMCDSEIVYPYCTECIVEKSADYTGEDRATDFRNFAYTMGDSVVFVEDESIIKLHVHTGDPGRVLSEALIYGSLLTIKVENMRKQHTELVGGQAPSATRPPFKPTKRYAIVTVAGGEGICEMFEGLGVDEIVVGGQTMNPSTEQLTEAIEKTTGETVILLPNNHNIVLVAEQAAALYQNNPERRVLVVPTHTIPQGVSAMCHFDENLTPEENIKNMTEALADVVSLSLTRAVRDAQIDDCLIRKGQFLGLVENKVTQVTDTLAQCLDALLPTLQGRNAITLYYGEDVTEEEAEALSLLVSRTYPNADLMLIPGGQPVYSLFVAGE